MSDTSKDQLRTASFKGVQFIIGGHNGQFGRRGVDWEFPFKESGQELDLGRKSRRFTVNGFFRGNNHAAGARSLVSAVEAPGPGSFVHPYLGTIRCACRMLRIEDDQEENQRETKISLELVEAPSGFSLAGVAGLLGRLLSFARSFVSVVRSFFVSSGGLRLSASGRGDANLVAGVVIQGLKSALEQSSGWSDKAVDAYDALTALSEHTSPSSDAELFFDTVRAGLGAIVDTARSDDAAMIALEFLEGATRISLNGATGVNPQTGGAVPDGLYGGAGFNLVVSPGADTEFLNAMIVSVRLSIAESMAAVVSQREFETADQVWNDYQKAYSILESEAEIVSQMGQDEVYRALAEYRSSMTDVILAQSVRLPGLVIRKVDRALPSLVLAHRFYGDSGRAEEIEKANPKSWPPLMQREVVTLAG